MGTPDPDEDRVDVAAETGPRSSAAAVVAGGSRTGSMLWSDGGRGGSRAGSIDCRLGRRAPTRVKRRRVGARSGALANRATGDHARWSGARRV